MSLEICVLLMLALDAYCFCMRKIAASIICGVLKMFSYEIGLHTVKKLKRCFSMNQWNLVSIDMMSLCAAKFSRTKTILTYVNLSTLKSHLDVLTSQASKYAIF